MFSSSLRFAAAIAASIFATIGCISGGVYAQESPDAGALLRQYEKTAPIVPPSSLPDVSGAAETEKAGTTGMQVLVKGFVIEARQFPEEELQQVVAGYIGKNLTLVQLQEAARKISSYYLDHGFVARAYLPPQTIKDGIVRIVVLEGRLGQIRIDPSSQSRFDGDTARAFVENRVETGQILHADDLHEGIAVLNEVPGVDAVSSLQPGAHEGETDAVVKLSDGPLVTGGFRIDNEGLRSVGSMRGIATGSVNDALGIGDQVSAAVLKTWGSDYARIGMTLPAGVSGLRYGVNASLMHYSIDPGFNAADQNGYAYTAGAVVSYPVMRHSDASVTVDTTFDHKRLVNTVAGANSSDKNINVATVHAGAALADGLLWAGAINTFSLSSTFGSLDLSGNRGNLLQDRATARTDGFYNRVNMAASRLQSFDAVHQLFVSASAQLAPQNLDSSEQMALGGPDGVRAYPTDEAMGDLGVLARVEFRHNVYDGVQLFDFYDMGWIQQHQKTWSGWSGNGQPNDYWLHDLGVGASWSPVTQGSLGLTFAHTLGTNPGQVNGNNSDGYGKHWRLLMHASYAF